METIETYIVRIYRRDMDDPGGITGIVEVVTRREKRSFSGRDELWSILERREQGRNNEVMKKVHQAK